ncbi:hypothetical protein DM02DRAFT_645935 [Periconia macrospinosa]|uniref:Uncharacterized protein n=1 Tax=Periconia macrospinosa TaxID=97972 RepID=A0A2V1D8I0_9PLEO|nr:hypothetical protein DM02DRAFT_645935 [Periconia macrospinosa]
MPPWVARQWHVLRPPTPVLAHRLQCVPRLRAAALRPYSTTSDGNERSSNLASINSAIIIPNSVANAKPDDLIEHITPVTLDRTAHNRFVVFLVTPSFAPWLLDDATFLRKALNRTYSRANEFLSTSGARIHALCAVVDKLPAAQSLDQLDRIEGLGHELNARSKRPPVSETGFEGLAYVTLRSGDSIPTPEASQPPPDQAAVSFVASRSFKKSLGHFSDTLRLPLANTVFQTGSPSTLIYSTWQKKDKEGEFNLLEKKNVTHHGVKLHTDVLCARSSSTLAIPLIPLTFPRRVEASMGNILRQVTGADGKTVVASHELEKVVPQFFSSRGEIAQATTVWALVMSREILAHVLATTSSMLGQLPDPDALDSSDASELLWDNLWAQKPPAWNELVPDALAAGARLHRVLSGGGGWGKKAGLLSLDPAVATSETPKEGGMVDGPGDLSSALQPVVRNGDYIQFFTSPPESVPGAKSGVEALKELEGAKKRWHWELGTIPSTADALTASSWQHDPSTPRNVFVLRNSFGALTEGGITINRHFKLRQKDEFSDIGASKVDVPFSRFSAVEIEGEETEASKAVDKVGKEKETSEAVGGLYNA